MVDDIKYEVDAGFFISINKDRVYSAEDMNRPYKKLISNGVFATPEGESSDELQVFTANDGMNVIVSTGNAFIGEKWFENPRDLIITIASNSELLPRIDSIIAQVDKTKTGRQGNIVYRKGIAASEPVHPEINTEENIFEIRLADISISSSCVKITQDLITDCRGSSDCPWITSLIKQVDTSTLYAQWQAAYRAYFEETTENVNTFCTNQKKSFEDWFAEITSQLDGDVAGNLLNQIKTKANKKKVWNIALDTQWEGTEAPYTKTVAVQGILATDIANVYPVWSETLATRQTEKEEYSKISLVNSADGSITLTCDEDKPTTTLNLRVEVVY